VAEARARVDRIVRRAGAFRLSTGLALFTCR